jgi:vanillate O-demethylase ferredoxin subunit
MDDAGQDVRLARVASVRPIAIDVLRMELEPADRRPFAPYAPGAHIDVTTPGGPVRQYSLCGAPAQPRRYAIAVKLERDGRGGSRSMHGAVEEGGALAFSGPRNHFPLVPGEGSSLFVAGGIGITPIYAMVQSLAAAGRPWELHYCARSRGHAAFCGELEALPGGRLLPWFSETPLLDVASLLREARGDTDLYCCGPAPLMEAVRAAAARWPAERVHFEYFAAPAVAWPANQPFEVELARSGGVVAIPHDRTILQALRGHGIDVPSACEEGVCGTCETRVLAGEPEHRDVLLSPAERAAGRSMMVCVSRSKSPRLVLDL